MGDRERNSSTACFREKIVKIKFLNANIVCSAKLTFSLGDIASWITFCLLYCRQNSGMPELLFDWGDVANPNRSRLSHVESDF